MKERFYAACVLGLLLIVGCATTNLTSFRDPEFAGKNLHKILVVVPFSDLESRQTAETAFVNRFAGYGVEAVPSMQMLMPTRTYTNEELAKILFENKVEGVLIVKLTDVSSTQTYVPQSSSTYGQGTLSGNTINYSSQTYSYGGYYISKPRVRFELQLFDVSSGKVAWVGTSLTRGNAYARFKTLINSLAGSAVRQLVQDGLVQ